MMRLMLAVVLCAGFGSVGCTPSNPTGGGTPTPEKKTNPLVGTWEGTIPELKAFKLVFTFAADGKCTVETVIEDMPKAPNVKIDNGKQEGTYKQDDKKLIVTIEGKDKEMTIKELEGTKMVLTNDKGQDMTFTKK